MDESLSTAFSEIQRMGSALGLSREIQREAREICKREAAAGSIPGGSVQTVAVAALYHACRQKSLPVTLDAIIHLSRLSRREAAFIGEKADDIRIVDPYQTDLSSALDCISGLLGIDEIQRRRAGEILSGQPVIKEERKKDAAGFAAAALYLASLETGERRTQREVAKAAGVGVATLRNRCRQLVS
jgi:Transcription initiation factor TFIIIB, Brf1 subunit/Transcription initiation factor TFIIB